MTNTTITKNVVKSVSSQLARKASSWKQVAKQLSGLSGKIKLSATKNVDVHTALEILGVHVKGTSVTPHDLNNAWSEKLKAACPQFEGEDRPANSDWRCPYISRALPVIIQVGGKEYKAYAYNADVKEYAPIKVHHLCRVVKAEDKNDRTDVVVSAKIVCEGLYQSLFADDVLAIIDEDVKAWKETTHAFINIGTATAPKWQAVEKNRNGWGLANVVSVDVTTK